jgi:hypothetical protein
VVSEHASGQLWATLMTEEGLQNITYRHRRYRSVEGRRKEMEDTLGKNANASPTEDKEDSLIKIPTGYCRGLERDPRVHGQSHRLCSRE